MKAKELNTIIDNELIKQGNPPEKVRHPIYGEMRELAIKVAESYVVEQIKESEKLILKQIEITDRFVIQDEKQKQQIKELKALLKELTDLAERNNFSVPYYFKKALK